MTQSVGEPHLWGKAILAVGTSKQYGRHMDAALGGGVAVGKQPPEQRDAAIAPSWLGHTKHRDGFNKRFMNELLSDTVPETLQKSWEFVKELHSFIISSLSHHRTETVRDRGITSFISDFCRIESTRQIDTSKE